MSHMVQSQIQHCYPKKVFAYFLESFWQICSFTSEFGTIRWDRTCTKVLTGDSDLLHLDISI